MLSVVLYCVWTADDGFYAGVSGPVAYEAQRPAEALSPEEQTAQEQAWRAELSKVGNFCTSMKHIILHALKHSLQWDQRTLCSRQWFRCALFSTLVPQLPTVGSVSLRGGSLVVLECGHYTTGPLELHLAISEL